MNGNEESVWNGYDREEKPLLLRILLTLVKLWVAFCILGSVAGIVASIIVMVGIQKAEETGEDNFVTVGIIRILEKISGEEIDTGITEQSFPPEEVPESAKKEPPEEMAYNTENASENAQESAQNASEDDSEPAGEENTTWYLTLKVPEDSYFDIMDNLNYVTHDVFDKRLIPLVTDERVRLAGIVEFQSDYMIVMVTVDRDDFLIDGTYDEEAAKEAVYEQADIVITEWFRIMGG